ncbi:MAG: glycosyltransferase [Candidatus Sericytochromatia bacterium]|nr:glycosyltransferase [Candidatus Sericytochromatia bacterium]
MTPGLPDDDLRQALQDALARAERAEQRAAHLERELVAIYDSLSWRLRLGYGRARDHVLPPGTCLRRAYDMGLKGAKVWLDEGLPGLRQRLARRRQRLRGANPATRKRHEAQRDRLLAARPGARVVVFLPTVDWRWMVQRPHHLARALARAGCLVFYVTAQMRHDRVDGLAQVEDGVVLCSDVRLLHALPSPIVVAANLDHLEALAGFRAPLVVYDVLDVLDVTAGGTPSATHREAHAAMVAHADVVVATARRLHDEVRATRPDALLLPNACEPAHFLPDARRPRPADMRALGAAGRPVAGYYGALASWFDYGLLAEVARLRPGWDFVLLGPDYDGSARRLPEAPNVHHLGLKAYDELPGYLQAFDVAMIPFVVNDITRATSPVKLFEYLAGDRPVVATPIDEAHQYASVRVAEGAVAFAAALDAARAAAAAERALRARERDANTWQARAEALLAACDARAASPRDLAVVLAGVPLDDSGGGQRPAQLALALLARGWRVLYVHQYPKQEHRDLALRVSHPGLTSCATAELDLAAHLDGRPLGRLLALVEMPHPAFEPVLAAIGARGGRVIYDLIDDWATSLGGSWYEAAVEDRLARAADVLAASARTLQAGLAARTGREVVLVPNAVNRRLFDRHASHARPGDMPAAPRVYMYVGALWGEWFDWGLVRALAEAEPAAAVVLIGDYAGQCPFPPLGNMHFLGLKAQAALPAYLAHANVGLIPFAVSRLTQAVSPLKVFEYLSMGVPVAATGLVEVAGMPHVHVGDTEAAFLAAARAAAGDPPDLATLDAFSRVNGWEARVEALLEAAFAAPEARRARGASAALPGGTGQQPGRTRPAGP